MHKISKIILLLLILSIPLISFGQITTLKELVTIFKTPCREMDQILDTCYKKELDNQFSKEYYYNGNTLSIFKDPDDTTRAKHVYVIFNDSTFNKVLKEFSNYGIKKYKPYKRDPHHMYYESSNFSIIYRRNKNLNLYTSQY